MLASGWLSARHPLLPVPPSRRVAVRCWWRPGFGSLLFRCDVLEYLGHEREQGLQRCKMGRVPGNDMFDAPVYLSSFYLGVGRQLHHKRIVWRERRVLVTP